MIDLWVGTCVVDIANSSSSSTRLFGLNPSPDELNPSMRGQQFVLTDVRALGPSGVFGPAWVRDVRTLRKATFHVAELRPLLANLLFRRFAKGC
ncbi:hypothetical protein KCV03_g34, partial [Aureobasidium melanogenum]